MNFQGISSLAILAMHMFHSAQQPTDRAGNKSCMSCVFGDGGMGRDRGGRGWDRGMAQGRVGPKKPYVALKGPLRAL